MSGVDLLFIHGGPGFNSNPERRLLSDSLQAHKISCAYWDEPSSLRSGEFPFKEEKAYSSCLESLHQKILQSPPRILVASSFGALTCLDCLKLFPLDERPMKLLFISPTFDMNRILMAMMEMSRRDLLQENPEASIKLKESMEKTRKFWDEAMQEGASLAWQNPHLPVHYFASTEVLAQWGQALSEPKYTLDLHSQAAVLSELKHFKRPDKKLTFPATVLWGDKDPVLDLQEIRQWMRENFPTFEEESMEGAGHFPHLEQPEAFVLLVKKLLLGA